MTMVTAYTWQDRVIIMADSREHTRNNEGRMVEYNDEQEKITPVKNLLAFAEAGLRKVYRGEGCYFDMNQVTDYFIEQNEAILSKATGKQLLEGLVTMWNLTMSEKLGRNPFSINNRFSLLLAGFEVENGERKPRIHTYQSHFQKFQYNGNKAVIGDDGCYPIMMPYFQRDTGDMTFDQTLEFYLRGYAEVMKQVETIGGPIDIYVLEGDPKCSYWIRRKVKE
ncbi:hypothetical protein [Priestia megaterium]|uniref:hypothetical protein n=1 Tax=Priestia megaterium TaxID=1404 RepID=UPI003457AB58